MTTHGDNMEVDHLDSSFDGIPDGYYREVINHSDWIVPQRYSDLQTVGAGAYGSVCSSQDNEMEMVRIRLQCNTQCNSHKSFC